MFIFHIVGEERPDDDTITAQCNTTTVDAKGEGTDANANTENAATSEPTWEDSTNEDTNRSKPIVSSALSRNNPVN